MSKVVAKFNIIHPNKRDGEEDKQLIILTLSKRLDKTKFQSPQQFLSSLGGIEGIDAIQPLGLYSVQLVLANTFDYDSVIEDIKVFIEKALSDIIVPSRDVKI